MDAHLVFGRQQACENVLTKDALKIFPGADVLVSVGCKRDDKPFAPTLEWIKAGVEQARNSGGLLGRSRDWVGCSEGGRI